MPIAAMPGIGYRLLDGYFLPPLSLTEDEAAALALGGGFVRDRVDAELRRAAAKALRKLEGVLSPERRKAVARRRGETLFPTAAGETEEGTLAALRAAIGERRVVRMRYHALWHPAPEEREVEPVSLVHVGRGWHLAAYCRLRQAPRIFLLGRIDELEPLRERFAVGARHEVGPGGEGWTSFPEARVRFDASVVRWVREQQPYPFLREEQGGEVGAVFVYALRNEAEMLNWLLRWGAKAAVLGPPQLRERMVTEAWAVVRRHVGEEAEVS